MVTDGPPLFGDLRLVNFLMLGRISKSALPSGGALGGGARVIDLWAELVICFSSDG